MKLKIFLISMILLLSAFNAVYAQDSEEKLTISTYYPAPYGKYGSLATSEYFTSKQIKFVPQAAPPSEARAGMIYFDANTKEFMQHDGTGWNTLGTATSWHEGVPVLSGTPIYYGKDAGEGNVGIGTDTPLYGLDINGDVAMKSKTGHLITDNILNNDSNTFIGMDVKGAGTLAHTSGNQGYHNTAIGGRSLYSTTTGYDNTACGYDSLYATNSNAFDTAIGYLALSEDQLGYNTAVGSEALRRNDGSGFKNTALGARTLSFLTNRHSCTAAGAFALGSSPSSYFNTAIGAYALYNPNNNQQCIAVGYKALYNVSNSWNAGMGYECMSNTGTNCFMNTAAGAESGRGNGGNFSRNTLLGYRAGYSLTTGSNNILIGYKAGDNITTGANNIIIGYDQDAPATNTSNYLNIGGLIFADLFTGRIGIGGAPSSDPTYTLQVHGGIKTTAILFDIPHPDTLKQAQGYRLRHSAVEAPTEGTNIYRYEASVDSDGGKAEIELPLYWRHLNKDPVVWVSPVNTFGRCYGYVNDGLTTITVKAEKKGKYNVLLAGVRKDEAIKDFFDKKGIEYQSQK
ncbi:MAG: hypothetical protein ABH843_05720 [Candidatus Omnitrophota bacterium]